MSLFEWMGESHNPGPVGDFEPGAPLPVIASKRMLYARGVIGAALILGALYAIVTSGDPPILLIIFAIYLLMAYFVRPRPDYSNFGWLGGFMDHPFRWSDDVNRGMAFTRIVLFPGLFAVVSVRDMIQRSRGKHVIVLERLDK